MRLALVLLCLAAPANAVTFHLVGAQIDTCTSHLSLPGDDYPPVPDPTPCIGKVGLSLDGKIKVVRAAVDGKLRDRWLTLHPGELPPLGPTGAPQEPDADETYITNAALKVRLGLDWGDPADHYAKLHLNKWGNIDRWFLGTVQGLGAYGRETASWATTAHGLEWSGSGPAGKWYKHRTAVAGPVPQVSPVPLPATAWLLLSGLFATGAGRLVRKSVARFAQRLDELGPHVVRREVAQTVKRRKVSIIGRMKLGLNLSPGHLRHQNRLRDLDGTENRPRISSSLAYFSATASAASASAFWANFASIRSCSTAIASAVARSSSIVSATALTRTPCAMSQSIS
jgi:hypothetical protein